MPFAKSSLRFLFVLALAAVLAGCFGGGGGGGGGGGTAPTVYIAGYRYDGTIAIPCYWTGTSPTTLPLPAGVTKGWAESVAVSGGTVYTAGYYEDAGGNDIPCCWQGATLTALPLA